ncbi:MAG: hypothetical protein E7241_09205 [Lachnospiraceae bacterium]|nr:hypothetical protein [Lachnospiraceae bacterium]
MVDYPRLIIMATLPIIISIVVDIVDRRTRLKNLPLIAKQVIIGIIFGICACLATEFGIDAGGATVNVRDAAPLCAGLFFGGPAGIIAGLIGGIERWFAVMWGAGTYTRLACSISTIMAGMVGAIVKKTILRERRPNWLWAYIIGTVVEIFHMLMIFITNMDDISTAFTFVKICSLPMVALNGLAVFVTAVILTIIGEPVEEEKKETGRNISRIFQRWLLLCMVVAFAAITGFIWMLQTQMAETSTEGVMKLNINDVVNDISKASDTNLLSLTKKVANTVNEKKDVSNEELRNYCALHGVAEINIIRPDGIIISSSNDAFMGYDMYSGDQSREFMNMLKGGNEYVQSYRAISYDSSMYRKYAGVVIRDGRFIQVGHDAESFQKDIMEQVKGITKNRHIGQNGFVLVCNEQGVIVSDANNNEGKNLADIGITLTKEEFKNGQVVLTGINGEPAYVMTGSSEGYDILAVYFSDEVIIERDMSVYVTVFMEIILFATLFIGIYWLINKRIVTNVRTINKDLSRITAGDLDVVVDVHDSKEFSALSEGINITVNKLKENAEEIRAKINQDLEYARNIQTSMLPSVFPHYVRGKVFDIFTSMDPAKVVGGDFYDFFMTDRSHFVFLVADVSGKGIPAAMFMMTAKTQIKALAEQGLSAAEIMTEANNRLCETNEAGMFVTVWLGILDITTGVVQYVNAGHNPPVLKHGGEYDYFRTRPGLVLAGMEGVRYKQGEFQLEKGDVFFLYTDGVTEATNDKEELFGEERLLDVLNALYDEPVEDIGRIVKRSVEDFAGDAPQFDDITMMVIKYKADKEGKEEIK